MEKFRGQFIVGDLAATPEGFDKAGFGAGHVFAHHPALPVAVHEGSLLAGLVFDSEHPEFDIGDILRSVLADNVDATIERTNRLAGRWVLIFCRGGREIVFHDACGTMPVMIFQADDGPVFSSSTRLISACVDGPETDEFFLSDAFRQEPRNKHSGLGFPGTRTDYKNVHALLANHAFDLLTGKAWRYHPLRKTAPCSVETAAPQIARILGRIMESTRRFPLTMGVTGGFDSRTLCGALPAAESVQFFTFEDQFGCPPGHSDIRLGKAVAETIGGTHETVPVAAEAGGDIAQASESMLAPRFEQWAEASSRKLTGRTVLSGWCSEIGRAYYRWPGNENASARQIAACNGYGHRALAEHVAVEHASWFAEACRVRDDTGINILDLFCWELRSRWIGSGLNILNTGCNWVSIYSCRALLDLMLSVPEKDRGGRDQRLYRAVIKELNPALLDIPFNPKSALKRLRQDADLAIRYRLGLLARSVGLYEWLVALRGR
jgi:hypothetical protein